jgi:hypothetical protein
MNRPVLLDAPVVAELVGVNRTGMRAVRFDSALVQKPRRRHYELATEVPPPP